MQYAGRQNVFETSFEVPVVGKDYEVLELTVTASQPDAGNFGVHTKTVKLIP